ncbi:MAG: Gfo/Idh/MocA family protein [Anaerolineae bacterium]
MALKAAVIGLGILGSQHADYLAQHPGVDVAAVADVRSDVAGCVAERVHAQAYTDYREMLRAHRLDLVVVATPDPLHREPTIAVLEAGVPNVIQEKPLATTLEDASAIYDAAEKRGAHVFVNFANRTSPLDIATRYVIQQGLLGRVVYGESRLDDNIIVPRGLWGTRSQEWAAGSSTAHFLLSHVVDLLRWYLTPAEVSEVYAISQREVLGNTPDVYDAFLTFDNGARIRAKAEWIKHIDELVEFYMCFSGAQGTLIYNKRGGFGTAPGWRANLSDGVTDVQLRAHQEALSGLGAKVRALVHQPEPVAGSLAAGGTDLKRALEFHGLNYGEPMALVGHFVDAIEEGTLEPKRWQGLGPLPEQEAGLRQVRVVSAIIESAAKGQAVQVRY